MLIEKLEQGANFTNNEREVARYILENPDKVPGMSSTELAQASFTSKATVVRLSQKLGLKGYRAAYKDCRGDEPEKQDCKGA